MQREGEVEHTGVGRKRHYLAGGREHHNFAGKKIEFDGVEEIKCVGLGIFEDVLNGL